MSTAPKTIVITGASRGLGAGMARWFVERGAQMGLCSRSDPALPSSATVYSARVDVSDAAGMEAFVAQVEQRFGVVDLWINNAGVLGPIGPLRDAPVDGIRAHLDTNILGVFLGSQSYLKHLYRVNHRGVLINLSSGAARRGYAGWTAYCASKAAVDRFTEALVEEEAPERLRAYSVAPGVIDTGMQEEVRGCTEDQFPMVQKFHELKAAESFNTPPFVAQHFWDLAFEGPDSTETLLRLPDEHS